MDLRKRNIVISLMVAMFLGAVEGTVVTTAVPTIVKALNGFELISWVFSIYLLTSAISTPIYGKLSDLYGRKNILSIGIIVFITGSFLCGVSGSMYQLIIFRALQGLGAGAIFTVTYTIVGDIFTLSERAKVQGWLGTVWGVASLAGPFLGGFLIDYLSWHWIFFINVPFGILSIVLLQRNLDEHIEKKKVKIDYAGTLVLSLAILLFLYGTMSKGEGSSAVSGKTFICLAVTLVMFIAFYYIEKRVSEPIIPFEIFTKTNIIVNIISFLISSVLIGTDVYMPLYIQNILGFSPTISGLAMAPMSLAWTLSAVLLSKAIPKYGERVVTALSALITLISCVLLVTLNLNSSIILVLIYAFIMGFGFGGAFTILTIVVQSSVEYSIRGAATAANSLVRTIGQTIGVSILGSIVNLSIVKYFNNIGIKGIKPDNIYSSEAIKLNLSAEHVKASIYSGIHLVFIILVVISVLCLALSLILPNKLKENNTES
ncbi:transporter, major facilitator family protein [Clostridiales bacterium oral taxon 876 str. F0540]|nr:transporter, major facilitator family protein [Clostridiales bacterium oral taxon 876 str. F0540]